MGGKKMGEREESGLDGGEGKWFFMVTLGQANASKFACASKRPRLPRQIDNSRLRGTMATELKFFA